MKSALLSVWDKRGLVPLARRLREEHWQLIASGGTARALQEGGLEVISVQDITTEPELFGGRVKTLHPAIHAGILAPDSDEARRQLASRGWPVIDLVVVNLYPFRDAVDDPDISDQELLEYIDIGGAALLRGAAKNHTRVTALSNPADYPSDLKALQNPTFRREMAQRAFAATAAYDQAITRYFEEKTGLPGVQTLTLHPGQSLRYGENPHQEAAFFASQPGASPFHGQVLGGKPLSYNNLLDLEGAWRAVRRFERPAVVVVKHTSPCGAAEAQRLEDALDLALEADPVSAFGSVIASNRPVTSGIVNGLGDLFFECLIAPEFTDQARKRLAEQEEVRLIQAPLDRPLPGQEMRSLPGGYLKQDRDHGDPEDAEGWQVMTERPPTPHELAGLRFAWQTVMDVKSNAVVLARAKADSRFTVGIGGGQPNRADCVRLAGLRAGDRARGAVLASDAFFPFPDGLQLAADLGVTAVVQPGGSIRDPEVIAEANRHDLSMLFTGVRHFRH